MRNAAAAANSRIASIGRPASAVLTSRPRRGLVGVVICDVGRGARMAGAAFDAIRAGEIGGAKGDVGDAVPQRCDVGEHVPSVE